MYEMRKLTAQHGSASVRHCEIFVSESSEQIYMEFGIRDIRQNLLHKFNEGLNQYNMTPFAGNSHQIL
jgi:hypothetical protein